MIVTTLCLLLRDNEICLAMKKRDFGAGRWNGLGGKVHDGETIEQATLRELEEEARVSARSEDLIYVGELKFYFKPRPEWAQAMHIYFLRQWQGEPEETDEMKPRWFPIGAIPYDQMWVDDRHWLPKALKGIKIDGEFFFADEGKTIEKFEVRVRQ